MEKREILLEIKEQIDRLKKETVQLESSIKEMLSCMEKTGFVSEPLGEDVITCLTSIHTIQKNCKKNYLDLMNRNKFPDTMD